MLKKTEKKDNRFIRHLRIRSKVIGTAERPRFSVYRSNKHIYSQLINDEGGYTLCSSSTIDKTVRSEIQSLNKLQKAITVGKELANIAKSKGIRRVVFDRSGYKFHGRIKALAEGARDGGLLF